MAIGLHHQSLALKAGLVAAELTPRNEELLLRREAVDVSRARLAFQRLLVSKISDLRSAQVANALAQNQFAVVMYIFLDKVIVELARYASPASLKIFEISVCPPVTQSAQVVELRALIVKAVRDFVANNHPNGTIVHGIHSIEIKSRRLQNARREHDLIQQRIVVRVRSRRRHAPAAAIHKFANRIAIVLFRKLSSRNHILEERVAADRNMAIVLPLIGISNLAIERRDLRHRLFFGVVAHPRPA